MKLSLWQPQRSVPATAAFNDFDQLLDSLFQGFSAANPGNFDWAPRADVTEDGHGYLIRLEVPGFGPDSIEVSFDGDVISIEGSASGTETQEDVRYHRIERRGGRFSRRFHLPRGSNTENASAELADGILEVRIPKNETAKRRLLPIKRR